MPQSAPATKPATTMSGKSNQEGRLGKACGTKSATPLAANPPMASCPSAPMFQNSIRKATETPSPQSIKGIALTMVSENSYLPPKAPLTMAT